jgi:predicted NUDIX family phosphoesterase
MKLALCINTSSVSQAVHNAYHDKNSDVRWAHLVPIDPEFFNTMTFLSDRAHCETDESTLQLLPYLNIVSEDGRMFTYTRGGSGEEARLHGNFSVGLGGHVDIRPEGKETLLSLLKNEAAREGEEEAGLNMDMARIEFSHFICDGSNPVGRVHLGLLCTYHLTNEEADALNMNAEAGVVDSGRWETVDTLALDENFNRLENWSKAVVSRAKAIKGGWSPAAGTAVQVWS